MPRYLCLSASFVILLLVSVFFRPALLLQALVGCACILIRLIGNEQWYVVFVPLSLLILMLSGLDILALLTDRMRLPHSPRLKMATLCLGTALFVSVAIGMTVIEPFRAYPEKMAWEGFRMSSPVPYIAPADVETLTPLILQTLVPRKTNIVHFPPRGDALFFWQASKGRFKISDPTRRTPEPDIVVAHVFPSYDPAWGDGNKSALATWHVTAADRVHTVGESSEWFIHRVKRTDGE